MSKKKLRQMTTLPVPVVMEPKGPQGGDVSTIGRPGTSAPKGPQGSDTVRTMAAPVTAGSRAAEPGARGGDQAKAGSFRPYVIAPSAGSAASGAAPDYDSAGALALHEGRFEDAARLAYMKVLGRQPSKSELRQAADNRFGRGASWEWMTVSGGGIHQDAETAAPPAAPPPPATDGMHVQGGKPCRCPGDSRSQASGVEKPGGGCGCGGSSPRTAAAAGGGDYGTRSVGSKELTWMGIGALALMFARARGWL